MKRIKLLKTLVIVSLFCALAGMFMLQSCENRSANHEKVILIGIDGMGISGFQQAKTPNLDALVRSGALSFKTRSVMPTVSAPNWGSHLLGAGPEQHGITYNGWTTTNHTVEPTINDEDGYFPSVFTVIREQMPSARMGFFYDWDALADLYNLKNIDQVEFSKTFEETFQKATPWIIENDPDFTFIYIGHPDEEGHAHQWGSKEYIMALEDVDASLGDFFKALENAGKFEHTHFIIVTDHGGVGYSHGGLSMEEIEVPWIISGPGIIQNRMISQPNDVFNTASTIVRLFGLDQPPCWIGRPVMGAFEGQSLAEFNNDVYVPQPSSSMKSGLYLESDAVVLTVSDPKVVIRLTLNGEDPTEESPVYKGQVLLTKSTVLKAAGFIDNHRSGITEVDFVKVKNIKSIKLVAQPAGEYKASGSETLTDLEQGTVDYKDGNWLGFQGTDLEAELNMGEITDFLNIRLGIMNNPASWIFAPVSVRIWASVDGGRHVEIGSLNKEQIEHQTKSIYNELQVKVKPSKARYLKVFIQNTGVCPPGHSGEGEPAWLFVDEIIVE